MAVKIRLKRMGNKKNPFYRMVVADERAPRDGRYIEELGYYNPFTKEMKLDNEKALQWISNGAQPTDTARSLLKKNGAFGEVAEVKKEQVKKPSKKALAKAQAAKEAEGAAKAGSAETEEGAGE